MVPFVIIETIVSHTLFAVWIHACLLPETQKTHNPGNESAEKQVHLLPETQKIHNPGNKSAETIEKTETLPGSVFFIVLVSVAYNLV